MFTNKFNSLSSYIKRIGLLTTLDYILQRYITRASLIVLEVPGINGKIHLRRNTKDVNVFHQIFIKGDFDFLKGKDCKVCIDAGANIGLATIFIKNLFKDAIIYSIEPESENVKMLKQNTSHLKDIIVIEKALGEDSNGLFFSDIGNGSDSFQTSKQKRTNNDIKVPSISMQDLIDQYQLNNLDLVKIDIEGAEDFCITGKAMLWINMVKLLAVEIHEEIVPGCTKRIKELLSENFEYNQQGEYSLFENRH